MKFTDDIRPGHRYAFGISPLPGSNSSKDGCVWQEVKIRFFKRGGIGVCRLYNEVYRSHTVGRGNFQAGPNLSSVRDVCLVPLRGPNVTSRVKFMPSVDHSTIKSV